MEKELFEMMVEMLKEENEALEKLADNIDRIIKRAKTTDEERFTGLKSQAEAYDLGRADERSLHITDTTRDLPEYPNKATDSPEKGNQITTPSSDNDRLEEEFKDKILRTNIHATPDFNVGKYLWNWILSHAKELGELTK